MPSPSDSSTRDNMPRALPAGRHPVNEATVGTAPARHPVHLTPLPHLVANPHASFQANPDAVLLQCHTRGTTPVPNSPDGPRARRMAAITLAAAGIVGLVALVMREGKGDVLAVCARVGF